MSLTLLDKHWCVYCEEVNGATGTELTIHRNIRHPGWREGHVPVIPFRHTRVHPEFNAECLECSKARIQSLEADLAQALENKETRTEEEYRKGGWRCFHCDETFTTPGGAADHFGNYINSTPGCVVKVQVGDERGWLMELRRAQQENSHLRQQMDEEYWNRTAFYAHLKTHIQSYRPFRKCDTLQDAFNVYDSMEGRALAAEEARTALTEVLKQARAVMSKPCVDHGCLHTWCRVQREISKALGVTSDSPQERS